MWRYRCLHCGSDLGGVVPGGLEPVCEHHPEGAVQLLYQEQEA